MFVGIPGLTSELLRVAATRAGVHLYTKQDCNVYANGPYLILHACDSGSVQIDTGHQGPIVDLIQDVELGTGPSLSLDLKLGDTRILHLLEE